MNYVIANWKQNKTLDEAVSWCEDFVRLVGGVGFRGVTPIICPPMPFLDKMWAVLEEHNVFLGVQDVSPFENGAHTGLVGIDQIRQLCKYAIIGHSELHESRDLVMQKAGLCLDVGVVPIVCFKSPSDYKVIDGAIYALEDPDNISMDGVYRAKSVQEVGDLVDTARGFLGQGSDMVYGGSVNRENAQDLASLKNLSGVLVGNASLNPAEFADIVRKFSL